MATWWPRTWRIAQRSTCFTVTSHKPAAPTTCLLFVTAENCSVHPGAYHGALIRSVSGVPFQISDLSGREFMMDSVYRVPELQPTTSGGTTQLAWQEFYQGKTNTIQVASLKHGQYQCSDWPQIESHLQSELCSAMLSWPATIWTPVRGMVFAYNGLSQMHTPAFARSYHW